MAKFWTFHAICFFVVSELFSICLNMSVSMGTLFPELSMGIDYTLKEGKFSIEEEFQNNRISGYNVKKVRTLKNSIFQKNA